MLEITNDKEKYVQEFFLEFYQSVKWIVVEIKSEKKLSYVATVGSDVKVRP